MSRVQLISATHRSHRFNWLQRLNKANWRWSGLFSLVLAVVLGLNACNGGDRQTLQPLKVGIATWPGFDIMLYAQTADLFKQRGLQVELVRFENQQDATRAMLRGSLDATFTSLWDVVQLDAENDKPVVLLVTNISKGADGIVARSGLQTIADLKGKKVGAKLGTVNHLILLEALKHHQLKPQAVTIEDISNEAAAAMMVTGKLDAAVLWEPLLSQTAAKVKGKIIYTTKELNSLVIDTLTSRAAIVQSKKAELTQFIAAWLDVMQAVETKPADVYAAVGQQLNQTGAAFAKDYAGLQKGDIAMQQRMFQAQAGLPEMLTQMTQILREDRRANRVPRENLEINSELVTAAIEGRKS